MYPGFFLGNPNDFMRMEKSGQLDWGILSATGQPGKVRPLRNIRSHRNGDPADCLNSFSKEVHEFALLFIVLVVQEMQLVEGRSGYLPMVFLIHVAEG